MAAVDSSIKKKEKRKVFFSSLFQRRGAGPAWCVITYARARPPPTTPVLRRRRPASSADLAARPERPCEEQTAPLEVGRTGAAPVATATLYRRGCLVSGRALHGASRDPLPRSVLSLHGEARAGLTTAARPGSRLARSAAASWESGGLASRARHILWPQLAAGRGGLTQSHTHTVPPNSGTRDTPAAACSSHLFGGQAGEPVLRRPCMLGRQARAPWSVCAGTPRKRWRAVSSPLFQELCQQDMPCRLQRKEVVEASPRVMFLPLLALQ